MISGIIAALALTSLQTAADAPGYQVEVLAEGLDYPWAVAEMPDGDFLITERSGALRWINDGQLRAEPVSGTPDSLFSGQGGLMDIMLAPDYEETGWIYLTWSEGEPRNNQFKLARTRFEFEVLLEMEEIFVADPVRTTDVHYGARLDFLPDGSLILGIGDGFDLREQAQIPSNHYGSFVRLEADGTPFPAEVEGGASGLYSYGHRNPQAVVVDQETGIIYAHEHGPRGGDEINRLEPGGNYGWPITSYGIDYTGALVTPFETYSGVIDPLLHWTPSIAPSAMALYSGEMFADWQGDLLVTALVPGDAGTASGHLRRVDMENGEIVGQEILLGELEARLRDVFIASDGAILVLTDGPDGQLLRITP